MKIFGHSAHQVLIVFPVGLLMTSLVFDLIALATGSAQFWIVSYWLIAGGLIGGVVAAVFGALDWSRVPGHTRANRIAILHGAGNTAVLLLFVASWSMRSVPELAAPSLAILLSIIGASLLVVTGWLGGELVARLSVGVDEHAHVNAPSSMADNAIIEQRTSYRDAA